MNQSKGIILVEALIAVVILSLGIATILKSLNYSARATEAAKNYLTIEYLLYEKMNEYIILPKQEEGLFEGRFENPYTNILWKIEVKEKYKSDALLPGDNTEEATLPKEPVVHLYSIEGSAIWESKKDLAPIFYSTQVLIPENVIEVDDDESKDESDDDIRESNPRKTPILSHNEDDDEE